MASTLDIPVEIDARLPYRIGRPCLPVLPVVTETPTQASIDLQFPNFSRMVDEVREILTTNSIPLNSVYCVHRATVGDNAVKSPVTLVLVSKYSDGCQSNWVKVVVEVYQCLSRRGIVQPIELIDEQVFYGRLNVSPVLSTHHDLIEGWGRIMKDFLAVIERRDWLAIDVLYREFPSRKPQPTVIINAADADDRKWWDTLLPRLSQLTQSKGLEVDIVLLHLSALDTSATGSPADVDNFSGPHPEIAQEFYDEMISMGSSFGGPGSHASVTLGGKVRLRKGDSTLDLALTNYRAARNAGAFHGPSRENAPPPGTPYKPIICPSDSDRMMAINKALRRLEHLEGVHADLSKKLELLSEDDPSRGRNRAAAEAALRSVNEQKSKLEKIRRHPRYPGQVYASSEFRTSNHSQIPGINDFALGWCLLSFETDISSRIYDVPGSQIPDGDEVNEVKQYCSFQKNVHFDVVKRGRTTNWTNGTLSAVPSVVRLLDPSPNSKNKWGRKSVQVYTIIGTKTEPLFLQPGDAGSFVLLNSPSHIPGPSIVGLGFASNEASLASYMAPMDSVMSDIQKTTGGSVVEPRNMGMAVPASNTQYPLAPARSRPYCVFSRARTSLPWE